ncbi:hypothetical protein C8R47DRAFT_1063045 [Mycena vitilis]|nr:hypothetical protein C8R47DRAFT_1063045 [Mycena vitilis]
MGPPPLPQNGVVFGAPPANAPDPKYPVCSAKFFPDLAYPGLAMYEAAEALDPEFATRAFYFFLRTSKGGRVYTTVIQADEAAKELGVPMADLSVHRRLLPVCNAIYAWCKETHNHPTPERCSNRLKESNLLFTYDLELQHQHIREYQNKYGVAPPLPHVHRNRDRKRVVLLGPLEAANAAADTLAAWKRAGAVPPPPPSPEIACAAAVRAMKAADRGELLWDSPQYQAPIPAAPARPRVAAPASAAETSAAKRSAPVAADPPGFEPESPSSVKRRRFHPASSAAIALAQQTMPPSSNSDAPPPAVASSNGNGPSCYVLVPSPSKSAGTVTSSTDDDGRAAPPAGPRGWFILSNGDIYATGAEAEAAMKREVLRAKIVPDLEAAQDWLMSLSK